MFELVIGSKNWSSWSLRAWFVMKAFDIPFTEVLVPLRKSDTDERIGQHTPSRLVPVLKGNGMVIWDSLAIAETLADLYPAKLLWPADAATRAYGRAISAEMHSGFGPMRNEMPMDFVNEVPGFEPSQDAQVNIDRIIEIWQDARARYAKDGPYLLGEISIADAIFAPVVSRFKTYHVSVPAEARDYMKLILAHPVMQEWYHGAAAE